MYRTPLMSSAAVQALLLTARLDRKDDTNPHHLWLAKTTHLSRKIVETAGQDWHLLLEHSCTPKFYLPVTDNFRAIIEANGIYPAKNEHYYVEIFTLDPDTPDEGTWRVMLRYHQIIGARLLGDIPAADMQQVVTHLASLAASVPLPKVKAKAESAGVRQATGELTLLAAVEGRITLPGTHLTRYAEIKRLLETAGGRYNTRGWFDFPKGIDTTKVLADLIAGRKVNGKKDSQSFFSPKAVVGKVFDAAGPLQGKRALEPSAGDGALADEALRRGAAEVVTIENHAPNVHALQDKGYEPLVRDFLMVTPKEIGLFDVIVANPPFTKGQDMAHIRHMWQFLKPGGTLSTVASPTWVNGAQKKQREFTQFLQENQAVVTDIDRSAFRESGTSIATVLIRMKKTADVALPA